MKPLVSVIIPVYNHEEQLKRALDSVFLQTYTELDVIVVDDGSKKPVTISKYQNIKIIHQENRGAPAARNRGMQEAHGQYLIFWDADVVAEPMMLEQMVEVLIENRDAAFAYSNFYFGFKKMPARRFDVQALKQMNYIHSTSLIRAEEAILWDESLQRFQDWDYYLSLAELGKEGIWIDAYLFSVEPRKNGMSEWLPSFAYNAPWNGLPVISKKVGEYERAKRILYEKHNIEQ